MTSYIVILHLGVFWSIVSAVVKMAFVLLFHNSAALVLIANSVSLSNKTIHSYIVIVLSSCFPSNHGLTFPQSSESFTKSAKCLQEILRLWTKLVVGPWDP